MYLFCILNISSNGFKAVYVENNYVFQTNVKERQRHITRTDLNRRLLSVTNLAIYHGVSIIVLFARYQFRTIRLK